MTYDYSHKWAEYLSFMTEDDLSSFCIMQETHFSVRKVAVFSQEELVLFFYRGGNGNVTEKSTRSIGDTKIVSSLE